MSDLERLVARVILCNDRIVKNVGLIIWKTVKCRGKIQHDEWGFSHITIMPKETVEYRNYSKTDKLMAIQWARKHGFAEAAKRFDVKIKTLRGWDKREDRTEDLQTLNKGKVDKRQHLPGAGRKPTLSPRKEVR